VRGSKADDAKKHAAKNGSDHPHHQIADPPKPAAFGQDTAEPSGDETDDEGRDELREGISFERGVRGPTWPVRRTG
jgi:hypothetical protein